MGRDGDAASSVMRSDTHCVGGKDKQWVVHSTNGTALVALIRRALSKLSTFSWRVCAWLEPDRFWTDDFAFASALSDFLCHCADAPSASVNCSSLSALPVLSHFLVIFIFIICGFVCCQCACASSATRSFQFNLSLGSRCDANK